MEIQKFLENPVMTEAVKKVILSGVYRDGRLQAGESADPMKNFILGFANPRGDMNPPIKMPDAELGSQIRAVFYAVSMVESGFAELDKCKRVVPEEEKKINKAR